MPPPNRAPSAVAVISTLAALTTLQALRSESRAHKRASASLDAERRAALIRLLPEGQTVVTSTARDALPAEPAQIVRVVPGRAEAA